MSQTAQTYRVESLIEGDDSAYIYNHNVGLRDARAIATLKAKAIAKRTGGQYLRDSLDLLRVPSSIGHAIVRVVAN